MLIAAPDLQASESS